MKKFLALAAVALASCTASAPAYAQEPIKIVTVYEDMRVLCGNETGTPYKVRVMREAQQTKRELERRGYGVIVKRIFPFDDAPAGVKVRTRDDCRYN